MSDFKGNINFEYDGKKYEIDKNICFETYPCKHYVSINNETKMFTGVQIARLLNKVGIKDNHFNSYL